MKIKTPSILISEDEKFMTHRVFDPIYDEKGYFTGFYDSEKFQTLTQVKMPPEFYKSLNKGKITYSSAILEFSDPAIEKQKKDEQI